MTFREWRQDVGCKLVGRYDSLDVADFAWDAGKNEGRREERERVLDEVMEILKEETSPYSRRLSVRADRLIAALREKLSKKEVKE